jgi:hypothetical protein
MNDKHNDVKHEMPEADREFYIELGWLAAASVAIATALELIV